MPSSRSAGKQAQYSIVPVCCICRQDILAGFCPRILLFGSHRKRLEHFAFVVRLQGPQRVADPRQRMKLRRHRTIPCPPSAIAQVLRIPWLRPLLTWIVYAGQGAKGKRCSASPVSAPPPEILTGNSYG